MADTKFTKGPWIAGHLGSDSKCQCQSILAEGYMGCIATVEVDNGRPVSDGGNDAPPLEEAVANMHLIAAAPELYEALERLIKAGTDAFNAMSHYAEVNNTTNAVSHNLSGALDFGLLQLAKARGEAV